MELGVEPDAQELAVMIVEGGDLQEGGAVEERIVTVEIEERMYEKVYLDLWACAVPCWVGSCWWALGWAGEGKAAISLPRLRCERVPVRWGKRPVVLVGAPLLGPSQAE